MKKEKKYVVGEDGTLKTVEVEGGHKVNWNVAGNKNKLERRQGMLQAMLV